jgi:hypothetical protein
MTLDDAKDSLHLYVEHGLQPGHFLTAVLQNDLGETLARADESSRDNLFAIYGYIANHLPASCHGSPAAVAAWVAVKRDGR